METLKAVLSYVAAIVLLPPWIIGLINKTKAFISGRKGPPLFQPFYDNIKLFKKSAVYGQSTGWVFRTGPLASLSAVLMAATFIPFLRNPLFSFNGDALVLVFLLALSRFGITLAALDTGSSFEGMGASREMTFSTLSELALLLIFANLAFQCQSLSLKDMFLPRSFKFMAQTLIMGSLLIVVLAENSRIPFDDPQTHLELTMIHEAMILDHGGPDLGLISFSVQLKLTLMLSLIAHLAVFLIPAASQVLVLLFVLSTFAIFIGLVESSMARLRLDRIPQLLVAAVCAAALGFFAK